MAAHGLTLSRIVQRLRRSKSFVVHKNGLSYCDLGSASFSGGIEYQMDNYSIPLSIRTTEYHETFKETSSIASYGSKGFIGYSYQKPEYFMPFQKYVNFYSLTDKFSEME